MLKDILNNASVHHNTTTPADMGGLKIKLYSIANLQHWHSTWSRLQFTELDGDVKVDCGIMTYFAELMEHVPEFKPAHSGLLCGLCCVCVCGGGGGGRVVGIVTSE
jgi:hypothetical protein